MSEDYRERLDDLLSQLPVRNPGPRRRAPDESEPADQVVPVGGGAGGRGAGGGGRGPRRTLTRAHASAIGVLLVLVLAVVAVFLMRSRASEVPIDQVSMGGAASPTGGVAASSAGQPVSSTAQSASPSGGASAAPAAAGSVGAQVRVHVAGLVRHPGVYTLSGGARVADAITAAGGLAGGAHPGRLNLAQQVCDGCQVWIPDKGDGAVNGPSGTAPTGEPAAAAAAPSSGGNGLVNLNTATQAQLETIDGVGPVMAGKILAWRQEHGRFTKVEELQEISGVGPKTFERIKAHVTL